MADPTRKRVVVTGIGVITPLGQGIATFWENLLAGQCGIGPVTAYDTEGYACAIAAEVKDFDPTPAFPSPKEVRRTDRFTQFAMVAGWEAINDSGLDLATANRDRIGAFIGSGIGGLSTMEKQHKTLLDRGPGRVSPFFIPMMILNMASGMFSLYNGLRGPNIATCSACATASHAIGEAWRTLVMDDADVMLAGGTEAAVNPIAMSGFDSMKAMSRRNDDPQHASRPFDADRDGFVMGEGSGVVVLETLEHAKTRGARIYCEIAGYGNTADAHHMTSPAPGGEGGARAMRAALASGGLNTEDISYINAHGTSTPQGDVCETQAIKTVFGEHAHRLAVSS
ncbi:MAG: beta-ketoacyl-ACP synthase II, partial [Verrucomicrobiota bacterium]|nr:beta-ketoacyl-ACP synthase II [Verrucomicrobiota bacterium]